MKIMVDLTGTPAALSEMLQELSQDPTVEGMMIFACDANGFTAETIDPIMTAISQPISGGIFPQIIHGREKLALGTLVLGLPYRPNVQVIPGLSDSEANYNALLDEKFPDIANIQTMFVWVDGLSSRIGFLIDSLFNIFGLEFNYLGGGAGSLSFEKRPCLFTNQGLLQDCAVLVALNVKSGVGVSHGWRRISGPFRVTESAGGVIKTLDWLPAFEVYQEVVEAASGKKLTVEKFFDVAMSYPFGINKLNSEKLVRDPIMANEEGELTCVGEVPEECYVDILTGDVVSLVSAAKRAAIWSKAAYNSYNDYTTIFIDCISRVLFLDDQFPQELEAVYSENINVVGALTLGEIANSRKDYLELYNKTAVVGIIEN